MVSTNSLHMKQQRAFFLVGFHLAVFCLCVKKKKKTQLKNLFLSLSRVCSTVGRKSSSFKKMTHSPANLSWLLSRIYKGFYKVFTRVSCAMVPEPGTTCHSLKLMFCWEMSCTREPAIPTCEHSWCTYRINIWGTNHILYCYWSLGCLSGIFKVDTNTKSF